MSEAIMRCEADTLVARNGFTPGAPMIEIVVRCQRLAGHEGEHVAFDGDRVVSWVKDYVAPGKDYVARG